MITPINLPSVTTAANGERSRAMTAATSMMVSSALTDASWAAVLGNISRDRLAAQFLGYPVGVEFSDHAGQRRVVLKCRR